MAANGDVMNMALSALAAFIRTSIPTLTVLEEWPYANQKLSYPSVTITMTNPQRTPMMVYPISTSSPDSNSMVVSNLAVAEWEDTFQLDLWCSDKDQRRDYTDRLIKLFEAQELDATGNPNADGITLVLTGNFNENCRYEIVNVKPVDDEAGAQRQERREKITVLVNSREVRQRTYYAMIQIQLHSDASNVAAELTDDDTGTEVTEIS